MKKISWVVNMYTDWKEYRNSLGNVSDIHCDLYDVSTINEYSLNLLCADFLLKCVNLMGLSSHPKQCMILPCVYSSIWKLWVSHGN